jgi:hypothetical protein
MGLFRKVTLLRGTTILERVSQLCSAERTEFMSPLLTRVSQIPYCGTTRFTTKVLNMPRKSASYSNLLRQQQEIATRLEQARKAAIGETREAIQSMLTKNGFTLDEVFPRAGKGGRSHGTPRQSRTPKYLHSHHPMDGRSARAHPAFAPVKVDGRIDDAKARDRGMLNPRWVAEQRKGVLEAIGIKSAEAYAKKHRFDLPDAA